LALSITIKAKNMTIRYHFTKLSLALCFAIFLGAIFSQELNAQLVTGVDSLKIESGQWQYYDFTAAKAFTIADTATYTPDIWGSSNEGVNFGKEFSAIIPSKRILLLGNGDIDTVKTVPTWTDAAPWIDTSWDWPNGTQGQPISPGELWVIYTSEGLYVVMQIDELPNGNFGDIFTFKFKYMSEGGTTLDESNLNENQSQLAGSSTIEFGEGFDFSREEIGDNNDAGDYLIDFAFVSNEGVNFGNEGSTSLSTTGRRFLLLGNGNLDTLTTVPERVDSAPWVTVSYDFSDGTGGQPISVGQLWGVYTHEGNYAAIEITGLPNGDFGNSFTFNYKYQPSGSRMFDEDTSNTTEPDPMYSINIAGGDSQKVAPTEFASALLQVLVTDENTNPANNQNVEFEFSLLPAGTTVDGTVSQLATTDSTGIATAQVSGGDAVGEYQIRAILQSDTTKKVTFSLFVEAADTSSGDILSGSATSTNGTGFDFSREETGDNSDAGEYQLDFAFVANEGVNFGNESSSDLFNTGRRFLLLGEGMLDTLNYVHERIDAIPWVTVSYDFSNGTGGQPISVGQLWAVYTREGHYAAMEITGLPNGNFGNSFTFDYKYQPNGSRFFNGDTSIVVEPNPELSISIAQGDSQIVAPNMNPDEFLEVLVTDDNATAVEGEAVNFKITEQPFNVSISASVTQQTSTDTAGIAWALFTAGDASGIYKVRASLASDSSKFVQFSLFVNEEDTAEDQTITGTNITSTAGTGFDFSLNEVSSDEDFGNYQLDFAFVSNEGVNFGNEGSTSLSNTGRRFLLLGEGSLDSLTSVPLRKDEAPWVSVSYDFQHGTGGQPISIGQLWAVYTREGNYAAMEIIDLPDGNFGNSFTFNYKYQLNGTRFFDADTSDVIEPDPEYFMQIAAGDSQVVAPNKFAAEALEVYIFDENTDPVSGEEISFEFSLEPENTSVSGRVPQNIVTDTLGIAKADVSGGDVEGMYQIKATLQSDTTKMVVFTLFVEAADTTGSGSISGTINSTAGTGFDFSLAQVGDNEDVEDYQLDFAFVANEGVNFGNESSTSLSETGRRFLLLGSGSIDTLTSVPVRVNEAPWVTVSYDFQHGTGGQPISVGQLWAVYTREGNYAAMEIIELPNGNFGNSFIFDYKYQPNGSRFFEGDSMSVSSEDFEPIPESLQLSQNYPNPFNPATQIEYSLNSDTQVCWKYLI
jgi:hypothetical protein